MSFTSAASASRSAVGVVGRTLATRPRASRRGMEAERIPPGFLLPFLHPLPRSSSSSSSSIGSRYVSTTPPHRTSTSTTTAPSSSHRPATSTRSTPSSSSSSSSTTTKPGFAFPSHLARPTPYQIFHFASRAVSASDVKARYYDLVRTCHPDRLGSKPKQQAEEEFKTIIAAYNLLKDPQSKALYDRAGIGWGSSSSTTASAAWVDPRYRRKRSGHDRYDWQNSSFYSSHTPHTSGASAGWQGGNRSFGLTNGVFFSSLFILTWFLAGLQYSRLSLQSQKAIERADKAHLDAAKSLQDARREARSREGRERWEAYRRRARESRVEQLESGQRRQGAEEGGAEGNPYGIGHGGPSGKEAALERFAKAQAEHSTEVAT